MYGVGSEKTQFVIERRKGPDKWVKVVRILGHIALVVFIAVILLVAYAKPSTATFFDRLFDVKVYSSWDMQLIQMAFLLIITLSLISLIGLAINSSRTRRKSDRYNKSLIFSVITAIAGLVLYLYNFVL